MRILHIAAGLEFGGVAEVVAMLALHQQRQGCAVTMATVAAEGGALSDSVNRAVAAGVELVQFRGSFPRQLYFSWEMLGALNSLIGAADRVHVHSNWTFPVWWACWLARRCNKKLVMSPHGCLSPERLAHGRWKKRAVGFLDRYFLRRADVIHATCAEEAFDIRKYVVSTKVLKCASSKVKNRSNGFAEETNERIHSRTNELPQVLVVPNGVDLAEFDGEGERDYWQRKFPEIGVRKVVLALGRLHPLKGLDLLVSAAAQLPKAEPLQEWVLLIAGPDEQGTLAGLRQQVKALQLERDVILAGVIPAAERRDALFSAHVLVLPSRHENFGLTVVEALACRVPVIATKGAPWAELRGDAASARGRCGWWVEIGAEPLAAALREALALSEGERAALGRCGRELVAGRYSWEVIATTEWLQ